MLTLVLTKMTILRWARRAQHWQVTLAPPHPPSTSRTQTTSTLVWGEPGQVLGLSRSFSTQSTSTLKPRLSSSLFSSQRYQRVSWDADEDETRGCWQHGSTIHAFGLYFSEPVSNWSVLRQAMSSKVSPKVEDLVAIESAAASSPDFQFGLYNNYFPRCPDCPYISGAQTDAWDWFKIRIRNSCAGYIFP